MTRLTEKQPDGTYTLNQGQPGDALQRLGGFEDAYERLLEQIAGQEAEMEQLRAAGKQKSVMFKELLGRKVMNANTLNLFRLQGIE